MDEFITRRERGRSEGLLLGRIEGRAESARSVTLKLLQRRLGVISEMLVQRLSALSPEQLEDLSLASLDFVSVADLDAWLERHAPDDAPTH
jgi:predicted transposase YdaD